MEAKKIKPHGMSTEKASRVKTRGNNKEYMFAALIGGTVIKGTKKQDVSNKHGQLFSIKGGSEIQHKEGRDGKWQIFLHKKSKFEEDTDFPAGKIFLNILNCYPETYQEYASNKGHYKEKVARHMKILKRTLENREQRKEFFDKSFFDKKIDFFVVYDDDVFNVFDKEEVWNIFLDSLEVDNSSTFQKVVFKQNTLCAEIEVRTTDDGKYPSMLFTMRKRPAMDLLTEKIKESKKIIPVIKLCGKAIEKYKV